MLLRNHGAVCCGETIEEALFYAYHLVLACDTQLKMVPLGIDNLITIDEPTRRKVFERAQRGGGGVNSKDSAEGSKKAWGVGEMEFEAHMRMLDNAGYRSGYVFKIPLVKDEPLKPKSDVELPPAVSSLGYVLEEENLYKDGPLRDLLSSFAKAQKGAGRTKWVNSPNVYQKVEVLETGTDEPKKITKWVQEGSPSHSTPIKVESPNQFVPLGTTKKEFKRIQAAMKEGRRAGGLTAGPESKVLDGPTWEEARDLTDGRRTPYGQNAVDYRVGAASKGIIQRDFQHHATVYKSAYARTPFDSVSADELAEYRAIIDAKNRGDATDSSMVGAEGHNSTFEGDVTSPPTTAGGAGDNTLSPVLSPTSDTEHTTAGDHTFNGEETDGNRTFSEGEGDTSKAT